MKQVKVKWKLKYAVQIQGEIHPRTKGDVDTYPEKDAKRMESLGLVTIMKDQVIPRVHSITLEDDEE